MIEPFQAEELDLPTLDAGTVVIQVGLLRRECLPRKDVWPPLRDTTTEEGVRFLAGPSENDPVPRVLYEFWPSPEKAESELAVASGWLKQRITDFKTQEPLALDAFLEEFEEIVSSFSNPELRPATVPQPLSPPVRPLIFMSNDQTAQPFTTRRMEPLEVSVSEDNFIILSTGQGADAPKLRVHPAQVELLCGWIQEAQESIAAK